MAEKRNGAKGPVTEREVRAAYITIEGRRSIRGLHQRFVKEGKKPPSLRTMQKWSMKHQWVRLTREQSSNQSCREDRSEEPLRMTKGKEVNGTDG